MTAREKMVDYRNARQLDPELIARKLDISPGLLEMIESGDVTHPNIALRIQEFYGLSETETEELMPRNHRKGDADYDPDKFKLPEPTNKSPSASNDIYYYYLHDKKARTQEY